MFSKSGSSISLNYINHSIDIHCIRRQSYRGMSMSSHFKHWISFIYGIERKPFIIFYKFFLSVYVCSIDHLNILCYYKDFVFTIIFIFQKSLCHATKLSLKYVIQSKIHILKQMSKLLVLYPSFTSCHSMHRFTKFV